jgi:hypothetical protein
MKRTFYLLSAMALLWSCKPKVDGELGESFDKVQGINGTWEIAAFSQRDENNPIKEVRDLSQFYIVPGEDPTRITFNSANKTFAVEPGPGKNFFGTSGNWHFDDDNYPTEVILESPGDTAVLSMGTMPREFDSHLELELPRYCEDALGNRTPTVTYIFNIQRVQ